MKSEKDQFISLLDLDSSISINGESFVPLDENDNENNSEGILMLSINNYMNSNNYRATNI